MGETRDTHVREEKCLDLVNIIRNFLVYKMPVTSYQLLACKILKKSAPWP
jgi:hypothetical protein